MEQDPAASALATGDLFADTAAGLPSRVADVLFATTSEALLWLDGHDGRIRLANPAAQAMFGHGICGGLTLRDLAIRAEEADVLLSEQRLHAPLRYLRRGTGDHFPAELFLRWLAGEPTTCLATIRDLTTKLATERAARNAERRYQGIFGAAPFPILLINSRREVVDANGCALGLYGYSADGIRGLRIGELMANPGDARSYEPTSVGRISPSWHKRADGTAFLAEATLSTVRAARGTYTIAIVRDITDEEAIAEQLRASEERWRFALESHGEGLWEWHPDAGSLHVSPIFVEQLGYVPAELPPRFDVWESLVHEDDGARANRAVLAHLTGETEFIEFVCRIRRQGGEYRWVECRGKVMVRDATGRALKLIGTVRDVTEERERNLRERLHQEQLMHTARLASVGEMATTLAHELNQPLAAIGNFTAAALRRLKGKADDAEAFTALGNVLTLVERAGGVVHRIRDFTRKGQLRVEPLVLNVLVEEIARLLEPQCQHLGCDIALDLAPDLPVIAADRLQLGQLILNLAKNGLEAMVDLPPPRLLTLRTLAKPSGEVEFRVIDQGCGLPDQLALDVITPFFTTKPGGLGMGLVICQTIVANHHGRLWASPGQPRGTDFHVVLPAMDRGSVVERPGG